MLRKLRFLMTDDMIINELVSNCLKHAFPDGREGEVSIGLHEGSDQKIQLVVADNGIGLPKDVNLWNAGSLGLRLVRTLADQLGATVEVSAQNGTRIQLRFAAAGPVKEAVDGVSANSGR